MMTYEKPKMNFTSLQASHAVANACWPSTGDLPPQIFFYNSAGPGYVKIIASGITGGNGSVCGAEGDYTIVMMEVPPEWQEQARANAQATIDRAKAKPNPFKPNSVGWTETPGVGWST